MQSIKLAMRDLTVKNSGNSKRLYMKRRMYIPNDKNLQLFLLQQHHNLAIQKHPGFNAMQQKLLKNWFKFSMASHCKQYAINCATCRRIKAYNAKKQDLLSLLLILNRKQIDLLLDFVVQLPERHCQNQIFQHILVIAD